MPRFREKLLVGDVTLDSRGVYPSSKLLKFGEVFQFKHERCGLILLIILGRKPA